MKVPGRYFASGIDTVSLKNGNLHVSIPLLNLPGRELPLRLAMDYNTQFFEHRQVIGPNYEVIDYRDTHQWRKDTSIGAKFSASKTEHPPSASWHDGYNHWTLFNISFTWIDSPGTKYSFGKNNVAQKCLESPWQAPCQWPYETEIYDGHTIDSTSSEFIRLQTGNHFTGAGSPPQPATLTFKDGTTLNLSERTMRTRNGNYITANGSTQTTNGTGITMGDFL